jgi:drug/metabolite transporter (DMT)-like permease
MALGGLVNGAVALLTGHFQKIHWTFSALSSIVYLVIFGSWIGYSAYIYLLEHVPTPKVATYAYVNPIVAVLLGWIILREQVDISMLAGTAIIIASVALVNTSKLRNLPPQSDSIEAALCPKTVDFADD